MLLFYSGWRERERERERESRSDERVELQKNDFFSHAGWDDTFNMISQSAIEKKEKKMGGNNLLSLQQLKD